MTNQCARDKLADKVKICERCKDFRVSGRFFEGKCLLQKQTNKTTNKQKAKETKQNIKAQNKLAAVLSLYSNKPELNVFQNVLFKNENKTKQKQQTSKRYWQIEAKTPSV